MSDVRRELEAAVKYTSDTKGITDAQKAQESLTAALEKYGKQSENVEKRSVELDRKLKALEKQGYSNDKAFAILGDEINDLAKASKNLDTSGLSPLAQKMTSLKATTEAAAKSNVDLAAQLAVNERRSMAAKAAIDNVARALGEADSEMQKTLATLSGMAQAGGEMNKGFADIKTSVGGMSKVLAAVPVALNAIAIASEGVKLAIAELDRLDRDYIKSSREITFGVTTEAAAIRALAKAQREGFADSEKYATLAEKQAAAIEFLAQKRREENGVIESGLSHYQQRQINLENEKVRLDEVAEAIQQNITLEDLRQRGQMTAKERQLADIEQVAKAEADRLQESIDNEAEASAEYKRITEERHVAALGRTGIKSAEEVKAQARLVSQEITALMEAESISQFAAVERLGVRVKATWDDIQKTTKAGLLAEGIGEDLKTFEDLARASIEAAKLTDKTAEAIEAEGEAAEAATPKKQALADAEDDLAESAGDAADEAERGGTIWDEQEEPGRPGGGTDDGADEWEPSYEGDMGGSGEIFDPTGLLDDVDAVMQAGRDAAGGRGPTGGGSAMAPEAVEAAKGPWGGIAGTARAPAAAMSRQSPSNAFGKWGAGGWNVQGPGSGPALGGIGDVQGGVGDGTLATTSREGGVESMGGEDSVSVIPGSSNTTGGNQNADGVAAALARVSGVPSHALVAGSDTAAGQGGREGDIVSAIENLQKAMERRLRGGH